MSSQTPKQEQEPVVLPTVVEQPETVLMFALQQKQDAEATIPPVPTESTLAAAAVPTPTESTVPSVLINDDDPYDHLDYMFSLHREQEAEWERQNAYDDYDTYGEREEYYGSDYNGGYDSY